MKKESYSLLMSVFLLLVFNEAKSQQDDADTSKAYTTDVIEVNRAVDRESPVAFTDVSGKDIEQRRYGQDAPLLLRNVPGLFAFSPDGVGNGEARLRIRGFDQNYVQVLINGIPTNDPESNSVYWSNWGSVSSNAGSIQIQRGAGSSLYGAGSFGGSFNIVTEVPSLNRFIGANFNVGDPTSTMYGLVYNTGLIGGKFSGSLNVDRKISVGSRTDGRYEGYNYYTSANFFPNVDQVFKLVLHGAPQQHAYSWSQDISYFKKFGYTANLAPFLPRTVVNQLPNNATTGDPNYGLTDNKRELVGPDFVSLAHNFFHKPQLELHSTININRNNLFRGTFFWSIGRGGGSSLNRGGTIYRLNRGVGVNGVSIDTLVVNRLGNEGYVVDPLIAQNVYLANAFQRTSFSLHSQYGIIASIESELSKDFRLTSGGEFRIWRADHPGHFTNLYGKTDVNFTYARRNLEGQIGTFQRKVYQGDLDADGDLVNPFSWNMVDDGGTYNTQYRNYLGETPQFTIFSQGTLTIDKVNFNGSLQYVWYQYKLTENMPSENAIGQELTQAQVNTLNLTKEGKIGDKFYMINNAGSTWYEFDLVNADRSRGFLQPKIGLNYNVNRNFNVFANFAHVERFVNLGVYYNQGRINNDAEDEKSNQFELGFGWANDDAYAKINGYLMTWDNKSATITDPSKAGEPGYDRNGRRTELIGSSDHKGIELEYGVKLDNLLKNVKGFGLRGSFTFMENKWTSILDNVKVDPTSGQRRVFNNSARDVNGNIFALYFDELEGTNVASGPTMMTSLSLLYDHNRFFGSLDMSYLSKDYMFNGDTYASTAGEFIGTDANGRELFRSEYDNVLPSSFVFDASLGYNFNFAKSVRGTITLQALNLLDTDFLVSSDNFGLIPGMKRTLRANLSIGF